MAFTCNFVPKCRMTAVSAAEKGHIDCLTQIHEVGFSWDEEVCEVAAGNGHLKCLVYAHENGCPWDEDTVVWAARGGHLDCIIYAMNKGCPWDERAYEQAVEAGEIDVIEYLRTNMGDEDDLFDQPWDIKYTKLDECSEYDDENWMF